MFISAQSRRVAKGGFIAGCILAVFFSGPICAPLQAATGTEAASFLNIPVGAGPAALGAAYTALADDAYAPTWNPAGLGFLDSTQISGQHLAYLDPNHYEYVSFTHPLDHNPNCSSWGYCPSSGIGASAQYFGSGDIPRTDGTGNSIGNFSNHYAAYNLAYGRTLNERISWGLTGKWINAQLDNVSANAFAADLGGMFKVNQQLTLATTVTNVGTKLTFLNSGDSLPLAFHVAAAYKPARAWNVSAEGVYTKAGLPSGHVGVEWKPMELISLRAGYRTDTLNGLSPMAGLTTGIGLDLWGQEVDYAWLPLGELGNTQYLSAVIRFGQAGRDKRNLIHYVAERTKPKEADWHERDIEETMELFESDMSHVAEKNPPATAPAEETH